MRGGWPQGGAPGREPRRVRRVGYVDDEIVVVEEKNPPLEWLIKDALYGRVHQPLVVGKTHEDGRTLMQSWGRLDADAMMPGLRERLAPRLADRLAPPPQPAATAAIDDEPETVDGHAA